MKKALFTFAVLVSVFTFMNFSNASANNTPAAIEIPDNVQQIFDKSCYECHNTASKNKKAREKLDFDNLSFLSSSKVKAKLSAIADAVIEGEMPPKKYLKKHPEKALSRKDKEVLTDWIRNTIEQSQQPKVTLDSQLENLINQIVASLAQNDKSKIAVMDFVNMNGEITKLGRYMSEELTTRLYLTGKFEVIERQLLDKIVEEQKISMSGMIDENSAVELGRVLGVDAIASGTITDLGTSVKVNARLISAESGKLFSVASVEIPKNDKVKVLLSQSVAATTVAGTATSGTAVTTKTEKIEKPAANQIKRKNGYIFELLGAYYYEDEKGVIVGLKVTNTTEDAKEFEVTNGDSRYSTMIYTDAGDESRFRSIRVGSKMNYNQGVSKYNKVVKKIFPGSSEVLEIMFYGISRSATKINQLQILSGAIHGFTIEFRNIPLIKE